MRVAGAAVPFVLVGRGLAVASCGAVAEEGVVVLVVVVVRGGGGGALLLSLLRDLFGEQSGVAPGRGGRGGGDVELLVLQGRGRRDAVAVGRRGQLFFVPVFSLVFGRGLLQVLLLLLLRCPRGRGSKVVGPLCTGGGCCGSGSAAAAAGAAGDIQLVVVAFGRRRGGL